MDMFIGGKNDAYCEIESKESIEIILLCQNMRGE